VYWALGTATCLSVWLSVCLSQPVLKGIVSKRRELASWFRRYFGTNRKRLWGFLLVFNSNLGRIAVISCLSVSPSVTFVDCDHTRWNSLQLNLKFLCRWGSLVRWCQLSNASAVVENASFLFRPLYLPYEVPHRLSISKFTRLRTVSRRQHGSCTVTKISLHILSVLFQASSTRRLLSHIGRHYSRQVDSTSELHDLLPSLHW